MPLCPIPLTNSSAWYCNSQVRTGGWLISWDGRSHSVSLSFNHLVSRRIVLSQNQEWSSKILWCSLFPDTSFPKWGLPLIPREEQGRASCTVLGQNWKPLGTKPLIHCRQVAPPRLGQHGEVTAPCSADRPLQSLGNKPLVLQHACQSGVCLSNVAPLPSAVCIFHVVKDCLLKLNLPLRC